MWTFLTNKEGHGGKGSLAAAISGTRSGDIISVLVNAMGKMTRRKVRKITCDLSQKTKRTTAMKLLNGWYRKVSALGNPNFKLVIKTFKNHAPTILEGCTGRPGDQARY